MIREWFDFLKWAIAFRLVCYAWTALCTVAGWISIDGAYEGASAVKKGLNDVKELK